VANRLFPLNTVKKNNTETETSWRVKKTGPEGTAIIRLIFLSLLICLAAACATTTERPQEKKPAIALPESLSFLDYSAEDRKLFDEGLTCLKTTPERPADYTGARKIFETLVQKYPDSKWRRQVELWLDHLDVLARLEEKLKTCQQKVEDGQSAQSRLQQENEQLRMELRQLNEKYQEELNRVNQENEQLKRDIRLLKNMEIQRENRERMLR